MTLSEIARRLGLDRNTVRRYRDTAFDVLLASARDRKNVPLDRFKPYPQAEVAAVNTVATELYQQIRERGFRGGYSTLSRTPPRETHADRPRVAAFGLPDPVAQRAAAPRHRTPCP
ncbi:hypothetical protein [Streptomyces sp. NPDC096311]|uniref:hypothetical protein n=1 Tax=Streptomyces sp. NPDC096311 TaxID=3366083 RepID=UPI0037F39989